MLVDIRSGFSAAWHLPDGGYHGGRYHLRAQVRGNLDGTTGLVDGVPPVRDAFRRMTARLNGSLLNAVVPIEESLADLTASLHQTLTADSPAVQMLALSDARGYSIEMRPADRRHVYRGMFSAAHRTYAPKLSREENIALYGKCENPAGHGHNYRVEVELPISKRLTTMPWAALDHKNLSTDIDALRDRNVVTETIAQTILNECFAAVRVRVYETDDFYAEARRGSGMVYLGRQYAFGGVHIIAPTYQRPAADYGDCGGAMHGHWYVVEVVLGGDLDEQTETVYDLAKLDEAVNSVLAGLDGKPLNGLAALSASPATNAALCKYLFGTLLPLTAGKLDRVGVRADSEETYWMVHDE